MNKRVGDQNKKYLVAEMTNRQKRIVQLLASLFSLTVDDLVIKAINEFQHKRVHDHSGDIEVELTFKDLERVITIGDREEIITIENYPYLKCSDNGDERLDVMMEKYLEELIDFEVIQSLNDTKRPPKTIDFKDLLKME